jgi:hypothetical protein
MAAVPAEPTPRTRSFEETANGPRGRPSRPPRPRSPEILKLPSRSVESSWRPLKEKREPEVWENSNEKTGTIFKIDALFAVRSFFVLMDRRETPPSAFPPVDEGEGSSHNRCASRSLSQPNQQGLLGAPADGHSRPPPKKQGFRLTSAATRGCSSSKRCGLPSNRSWRSPTADESPP